MVHGCGKTTLLLLCPSRNVWSVQTLGGLSSKIKINLQFFKVERLAKTLKMNRLFN